MKKNKWLILAIMILAITGCTEKKAKKVVERKEIIETQEEINKIKEETKLESKVDIGLYKVENGIRKLTDELEIPFPQYQDIISLEAYYTKELILPSYNQKNLWEKYYDNYTDIENERIGYRIQFQTEAQEFDELILEPIDTERIFNYVQIYLYDDIHSKSNWYSHITQDQQTDETIFTSLKLTGSTQIDELKEITITAFTYDKTNTKPTKENLPEKKYTVVLKKI